MIRDIIFKVKCSPTIILVSGTIPFIAENITLFSKETVKDFSIRHLKTDGIAKIM
jgi:hypothetical protein